MARPWGSLVTRPDPDWNALRGAVSGEVLLPESPGYESTRKPAIARFHDARPRAVVLCETAEDVSEAISFARRHGLRTVPRSGGHCYAGRSSVDGIVIDGAPGPRLRRAR
jgi:FAD/FMN-containing dehydrogenase